MGSGARLSTVGSGAGCTVGGVQRSEIVRNETRPPSAHRPAQMSIPLRKPDESAATSTAFPAVLMPARTGMSAIATSAPTRATSLLIADAIPALLDDTAPSAVDVRAGTVSTKPRPKTIAAGNTAATYDEPGVTRMNIAIPTAAMRGPNVMGRRGPMRVAHRPVVDDSVRSKTVSGNSAAPAPRGE